MLGVKVCNQCHEPLPASAYHKAPKNKDGLHGDCKKCRSAAYKRGYVSDRLVPYDYADLRYRPIEQVIEALPSRVLGTALGIDKSSAMLIKRDASACVDTWLELDDMRIRQIRAWLETAAA